MTSIMGFPTSTKMKLFTNFDAINKQTEKSFSNKSHFEIGWASFHNDHVNCSHLFYVNFY